MKKTLWLVLILLLVCAFAFSSCDNGDTPSNSDNGNNQQTAEGNGGNSNSGDKNNDSNEPVVCEHTFGSWSTVKQATCKEEGKLVRTCSKCSETEESTASKTDIHTEVVDAAVSATCTVDGKTEGKHCSVCGKIIVAQITVKASGHTEVIDPAVNATCQTDGKTEGKHCSACNTVMMKQTNISTIEHDYQDGACTMCKSIDTVAKQAEIDAENERHEERLAEIEEYYPSVISGLQERVDNLKETNGISYVYSDSYCYDQISNLTSEIRTLERKIASLSGSTNSSDIAERRRYEAQLTQKQNEQNMYYKCITINGLNDEITSTRVCYSEAISDENALHLSNLEAIEIKYTCAANGHTVIVDEAKTPTCTVNGRTEGSHCSVCGFVITQCIVIDALGHTNIELPALESTCTSYGLTAGAKCTTCKTVTLEQVQTSLKEHTLSDEASCTTDQICLICKTVIVEKHHSYSEAWEIVIPATFESDGLKQKHCTVCNEEGCKTAIPKQELAFNLNNDGNSYTCSGIGTVTDSEFTIPSHYQNLPVTSIGSDAFSGNANIVNVVVSSGIYIIGERAFYNCSNLQSIEVDALSSVGHSAFYGCKSLTEFSSKPYVEISGDCAYVYVTNIAAYAFYSCEALKEITIYDTVSTPDNCTSRAWASYGFGEYAFANCTSLESFNADGVWIGKGTFQNCSKLSEITLIGIQSIPTYAFKGCTNLKSLTLGGYNWAFNYYPYTLSTSSPTTMAQYVVAYYDCTFQRK